MVLTFELKQVKIEVYAPKKDILSLQKALQAAGACRVGNYDCVSAVTGTTGFWRPLPGSKPCVGQPGELSCEPECKLECICPAECAGAAVKAVRQVHPYEEPVIHILPLLECV